MLIGFDIRYNTNRIASLWTMLSLVFVIEESIYLSAYINGVYLRTYIQYIF